ncbi:hypothetical protein ACX0G9_20305 [Flavitalea flava]
MIDIEKIADIIRPKETVIKLIPDTDPTKEAQGPIFQDKPFNKKIYQARDIRDFAKRKEYLLSVIEKEKEKENTPQFTSFPQIIINGETLNFEKFGLPKEIRLKPNLELISQCEVEIKQVNDLIRIKQIVAEYSAIEGENERIYYLLHASDGITDNGYYPPQYYSKNEFSQILAAATYDLRQINSNNIQLQVGEPLKPEITTRGIALYFYYLARCGAGPVTTNNAGPLAAKFGKTSPNSGKDLYNHYLKILKDEKARMGISGNANADNSKVNNLKIAIELLRTGDNKQALKLAISEFDSLKNGYDKRH